MGHVRREVQESLRALSRRESVTLYTVLLAAFNVLMNRYTGQTDIVLGAAVAGRNRVEVENVVGQFTNTIVRRADLSGDPTFRELVAALAKMVYERAVERGVGEVIDSFLPESWCGEGRVA
jgi:non-ribosomal peptide synthetase component F